MTKEAVTVPGMKVKRGNFRLRNKCIECKSAPQMTTVKTDLCWVCYRIMISAHADQEIHAGAKREE